MSSEDFGQRIPYLVRRVHGALSQRLDETLRSYGLTQAQLSALALLAERPGAGLSGAELSRLSGVTPQSMSSAVAGLEERGLVRRAPHPTHGRILEVVVTDDGTSLVRRVQADSAERAQDEVPGLDPDEQEQLRVLLRKVVHSMGLHLPASADDVP